MTDKQLKALTGYNGDVRELVDSVEAMLEKQGLENTYTVEELAEEGGFKTEDILEAIRVSGNCGDFIDV